MTEETLRLLLTNIFPTLILAGGIAIIVCIVAVVIYFLLVKLLPLLPKIKKIPTPVGQVEFENVEVQSPPPSSEITYWVKNPHSKCVHGKDYVILSNEEKAMIRKVSILEDSIIKEQMKLVDDASLKIANTLHEAFSEKITTFMAPPYNILEHIDTREFVLCLDKMRTMIKDNLRARCRENHFCKKDDKEYQLYIESAIMEIFTKTRVMFNHYYKGSLITRNALDLIIDVTDKENKKVIEDLFWHIRKISCTTKEEVKRLEDDFHEFFVKMF